VRPSWQVPTQTITPPPPKRSDSYTHWSVNRSPRMWYTTVRRTPGLANVRISDQTVRRRLCESGIRARRPVVRPILRQRHRTAILAWASRGLDDLVKIQIFRMTNCLLLLTAQLNDRRWFKCLIRSSQTRSWDGKLTFRNFSVTYKNNLFHHRWKWKISN
jgi:hypothetical protein